MKQISGHTEHYPGCERLDYGDTPEFIIKIIEATHIGMWDWDLVTDSFAVNDVWAHILGYKAENLSGHIDSWRAHLYAGDVDLVNATVDEYISGELDIYDVEYRMVKRDNTVIWVQEKGVISERDENGKSTRFIGTLQDITRHKETEYELENSQRHSHDLEEKVQNAASQIRLTDNMLRAQNETAALLLASNQDNHDKAIVESLKLLGKAVNTSRISIFKNFTENGRLCCRITHSTSTLIDNRRDDGYVQRFDYDSDLPNWKPLLMRGENINYLDSDVSAVEKKIFEAFGIRSLLIIPLFFGQEFWGFISFDDCERQRIFFEAEIKSMTSVGALLVSSMARNEMTLSLISAKEAALVSTRAKSAFLANMSHELRTPLTAIIGMAAVAKIYCDDSKKIDYCMEKIDNASKLLLGIINDVLDMSKIEAQRFELVSAEFSFRRMLRSICDIHSAVANEKRQCLEVDIDDNTPEVLIGDELRLSQVINNLVSNAIKFTPNGGRVRVTAKELEVNENISTLLVSVSDDGIGIEPEKISRIFNAFEQLDLKITRTYGGTGLGLSISKNIINKMDGDMWVESQLGRGSTFSFSVKLERGADTTHSDAFHNSTVSYNFNDKTFLLVDDIDINRIIIEELLSPFGVAIECADDGLKAVELFEAAPERYDLILMDMQMPVMDGLEAASRIRALGSGRSTTVPIIAMTANAFSEDIQRCLHAGMNDHISKPIDVTDMLKKIDKHLSIYP